MFHFPLSFIQQVFYLFHEKINKNYENMACVDCLVIGKQSANSDTMISLVFIGIKLSLSH